VLSSSGGPLVVISEGSDTSSTGRALDSKTSAWTGAADSAEARGAEGSSMAER